MLEIMYQINVFGISIKRLGPFLEVEMYTFFYPENGERFDKSLDFETVEGAIFYWEEKKPLWGKVKPKGEDQAAFINTVTGEIIVVRKVNQT